jgi:hypothetical protein
MTNYRRHQLSTTFGTRSANRSCQNGRASNRTSKWIGPNYRINVTSNYGVFDIHYWYIYSGVDVLGGFLPCREWSCVRACPERVLVGISLAGYVHGGNNKTITIGPNAYPPSVVELMRYNMVRCPSQVKFDLAKALSGSIMRANINREGRSVCGVLQWLLFYWHWAQFL